MKIRLNKKALIIAGILAAVLITVLLIRSGQKTYMVYRVQDGLIIKELIIPGTVEMKDFHNIASDVGGSVRKINFKVGDFVKKGQVMFVLDDTNINMQKRIAQSQYESRLAQLEELKIRASTESQDTGNRFNQSSDELEYCKTNYDQILRLFNEGAASKKDLDDASFRMKTAESKLISARFSLKAVNDGLYDKKILDLSKQVDLTRAQLDLTVKQQADTRVVSPLDGFVTEKMVNVGDYVSTGMQLCTVGNLDDYKIQAEVSQTDLWAVNPGSVYRFYASGTRNDGFKCQVTGIEPKARDKFIKDQVPTYIVSLDVLKGEGLKPGISVSLVIDVNAHSNIVVPLEALLEDKDKDANLGEVYLVEDGVFKKRSIVTGIKDRENVELLSGLKENEVVLLNPPDDIYEGLAARNLKYRQNK